MKPGLQRIRVHKVETGLPPESQAARLRRLDIVLAVAVVVSAIYVALWAVGPFPPAVTLMHLMSAGGCRVAQGFGMAHAHVGQPGYWPHLDPDHNGIACEIGAAVPHTAG